MISRMSLSSSDLNRAGKYNESSARNNALGGHQIQTPIGFGLEVRSFGNFHHKRKKDEFARLNQICEMSNSYVMIELNTHTHCAFEFPNRSQKCIFDASSMGCIAEAPLNGTAVRIHEHGPKISDFPHEVHF